MSPNAGILAALTVLVVAGVLFALARREMRRARGVRRVWKAFADRHGLCWTGSAEGGALTLDGAQAQGVIDGIPFRLEHDLQRSGNHDVLVTRMQVALAAPVDEAVASELLDTRSRARLAACERPVQLEVEGQAVRASWPELESDARVLEDVAGVVLSIARGRRAPQRAA